MTIALEDTRTDAVVSRGRRILNAVRLQYVNTQTFIWVPLIVLGGVWALTLLIYLILTGGGVDGSMYSGGSQATLWYFGVVGIQSVTLTFYFSQAMTLTRREFFLGAHIAAAISALGVSVLFVALGLIEQATNGYGISGYVAYLPWLWESGPFSAGLTYFVLTMLAFILGFWFTIVFKRFGALTLTLLLFAVGFVLLGVIAVITLNRWWTRVWAWFADAGSLELTLWAAAAALILAVGSYLTLRRITI